MKHGPRLTHSVLPTILLFASTIARAEQPNPPCHPNPDAAADRAVVAARGDVASLPQPLKDMLVRLADRPHSVLPVQVHAEADSPSQLFQYYLLDSTGFEPNVFTKIIPGVNDHAQLTATGANCGLPTVGAVRLVLEPKPGLPTDPTDPRAFTTAVTRPGVTSPGLVAAMPSQAACYSAHLGRWTNDIASSSCAARCAPTPSAMDSAVEPSARATSNEAPRSSNRSISSTRSSMAASIKAVRPSGPAPSGSAP